MRRAKQQLCRNVCTLLFNSLSFHLSLSPLWCRSYVFFSLQTFHLSHLSFKSNIPPFSLSLSLCLPPYPLDPHALIVLQEAQSRGVRACVCVCLRAGVCVCVVWYIKLTRPDLQPSTETLRDQNRHPDMLLSVMCVTAVWVLQYVPHKSDQTHKPSRQSHFPFPPVSLILDGSLLYALCQHGVCVYVLEEAVQSPLYCSVVKHCFLCMCVFCICRGPDLQACCIWLHACRFECVSMCEQWVKNSQIV